ncbi:hypothetical protein BJV77DRAFT_1024935 [Russula vinacea]|nr:hypothetical protein BJV77DRAFT_1024935 [Russula vinacea]
MYVGTALCSFFPFSSFLGFLPAARCGDRCVGGGSFSLNSNSSKNLTVASSSGVALPAVSGPPAPRRPFRSLSSLTRSQNGGECTSSCSTAFTRHTLLVFSLRARRRGTMASPFGWEGVVLLRRVSVSGKGGIRDGWAGMEKPTVEAVSEGSGARAGPASQDANDLF